MSKETIAKAGAVVFSLVILGAIELGCRHWLRHRSSPGPIEAIRSLIEPSPELFWVQRPNFRGDFFGAPVRTDRYGFRNDDGAIDREDEREYRIAILGASPAFGWGVPIEQTFGRILETRLRKDSPFPIQVINASVIGYSSWQGLSLLKKFVRTLRPNHLIVAFGINDVSRDRFFYSGAVEDKNLTVRFPSLLAMLLRFGLPQVMMRILSRDSSGDVPFLSPVRVSQEDFVLNCRNIAALANAHGSSVSFLIIPFHFPPRGFSARATEEMFETERRSRIYFQSLRDRGTTGNTVIDMTDPLYPEYERFFLVEKQDYIHPNPAGHSLIGEALAEALKPIVFSGIKHTPGGPPHFRAGR